MGYYNKFKIKWQNKMYEKQNNYNYLSSDKICASLGCGLSNFDFRPKNIF